MRQKRLCLWVFCVLTGGVLLWGLMQVVALGPTSAQQVPPELPVSPRVFGPSGRTLGGPGEFTGKCNGITRTIFSIGELDRLVCATVENTGQCRVFLRLLGGVTVSGKIRTDIDPGETETVCNFAERVKVECRGDEEDKECKYRWRVDDGGSVGEK